MSRPTAPANWWGAPNGNVLGGRDLLRKEQGTWLGVTKQGRIAVLTNFREEGAIQLEARSRGAMVNAFLSQPANSPDGTENFIESLVKGEGLKGVGGFSLVCGRVGEPLAVISNRTPSVERVTWIAGDQEKTIGLSNAAFADRSWPKVLDGEKLLSSAIRESIASHASKASFIEDMFKLLSVDTLPTRSSGMGWNSHVKELRNSIFIPAIGGDVADVSAEDLAAARSDQHMTTTDELRKENSEDHQSGVYGTQKQTVVLVDHRGRITFVERTLHDATGRSMTPEDRDRLFEFDVEGWSR